MSTEPRRATPERSEPTRRRRAIVWPLIVLASLLLVVSIAANWVQRALLDSDQVTATTDEILANQDVQEQLSIYAVDQLYAAVDVQGELASRLPPPAQPFAAPVAAATRQLATNVADKALASPQVQERVSTAVGKAQERLVALIRDEGEYVSTTGGEVTLDYGSVIAELAARLGLDPATISKVQGAIQDLAAELRQNLPAALAKIESLRTSLSQAQAGQLDAEAQQNLRTLHDDAAELRKKVSELEGKIGDAKGKVPSQLQGVLSNVSSRLSDVDARLAEIEKQTAAVLKNPSQANLDALDAKLASLQTLMTGLLDSQAVQTPGELVIIDSTQLDAVQTALQTLRNLGIVLPLLVLLLYVAAIYLAKGWRREALIAAGGGILAATLLVLFARRLIGNEIVSSLSGSDSVEPAVQSVWDILTAGLRERALSVLVIGLAFIGGGLVAGPARPAIAIRRFLAPSLREHRIAVYSVAAVLFLLWLAFIPGIENVGQVIVIVLLAVLAVVGIEILRRQTAREFPPQPGGT